MTTPFQLPFLSTLSTIVACLSFSAGTSVAQSPTVLRDLTLIRENPVASFNEHAIVLADGRRLGWDQVLKAVAPSDQQEQFDRSIREIGLPLFRLKTRIGNGDWVGAGEIAEPLYQSIFANGNPNSTPGISYCICLATMKYRLHKGDRAGALIPFVQAAMLQPNADELELEIAAAGKIPKLDLDTKLSQEILPVWFDTARLADTERRLAVLIETDPGPLKTSPGARIYLASLKIELGQTDEAMQLLRSLNSSDEELNSWRTVLEARLHQKTRNSLNAQTMLEANGKRISEAARPVALYYQGINVLDQQDVSDLDRSKAILTLLRIPALYGDAHRDLSAAALFHSAKIAKLRGRDKDAEKLQEELLRRYPGTYHGNLASANSLATIPQ